MAFSIGFSNFRQFKEFSPISIGGITFLVGGNNSGKSTLVKAILTLSDFFHDTKNVTIDWGPANPDAEDIGEKETGRLAPLFFFDRRYLTHIGTFSRALCRQTKSDTITFEYCDETTKSKVSVKSSKDEESTSGYVAQMSLTDLEYNVDYVFDFEKALAHIIYNSAPTPNAELYIPLSGFMLRPRELEGDILRVLNTYLERIISLSGMDPEIAKHKRYALEPIRINKKASDILRQISPEMRKYAQSNNRLVWHEIPGDALEYIYAHAVSQNVIYSAKDSNDYVANTIHEFAVLDRSSLNAHEFVRYWMDKFEIGSDFRIQSIGGEAHLVKIISRDGMTEVNLADKGMGSIQLMVMLFRLAILDQAVLPKYGNRTIIIEEPEQNLHPKLQSELANFFYTMHQENQIDFLVETHSEYLIRKTQVLVKENHLAEEGKENPFKVYYFGGDNADGKPYYEMKYQPDGRFANKFGKGFFDEATKLAYNLL